VIQTFLPVYAALRLTGPRKPTLTGALVRGFLILVLAPFVIFALVLASLLRLVAAEARQPVAKPPPFDYAQWQLDAARRKVLRNQEAYRRRQANKPQGFAGHIAELRNQQGETE
jgi:hypothetical protein